MKTPYIEENLFETVIVSKNTQRVNSQFSHEFIDSTLKERFTLISNNFNQEFCIKKKNELIVLNSKLGNEVLYNYRAEKKKTKDLHYLENKLKGLYNNKNQEFIYINNLKKEEAENLNYPDTKKERKNFVNHFSINKSVYNYKISNSKYEKVIMLDKRTGYIKVKDVSYRNFTTQKLLDYTKMYKNMFSYLNSGKRSVTINSLYLRFFQYFQNEFFKSFKELLIKEKEYIEGESDENFKKLITYDKVTKFRGFRNKENSDSLQKKKNFLNNYNTRLLNRKKKYLFESLNKLNNIKYQIDTYDTYHSVFNYNNANRSSIFLNKSKYKIMLNFIFSKKKFFNYNWTNFFKKSAKSVNYFKTPYLEISTSSERQNNLFALKKRYKNNYKVLKYHRSLNILKKFANRIPS